LKIVKPFWNQFLIILSENLFHFIKSSLLPVSHPAVATGLSGPLFRSRFSRTQGPFFWLFIATHEPEAPIKTSLNSGFIDSVIIHSAGRIGASFTNWQSDAIALQSSLILLLFFGLAKPSQEILTLVQFRNCLFIVLFLLLIPVFLFLRLSLWCVYRNTGLSDALIAWAGSVTGILDNLRAFADDLCL